MVKGFLWLLLVLPTYLDIASTQCQYTILDPNFPVFFWFVVKVLKAIADYEIAALTRCQYY